MNSKTNTAGYSGTPLSKKLGIKAGFRIRLINPPENYLRLLEPLPHPLQISSRLRREVDIVHIFVDKKRRLPERLSAEMLRIKKDGMIWVSWPKKSSKVETDMTENEIRFAALPLGLVDVKVCAVDEVWSGLKLVIRKINRR